MEFRSLRVVFNKIGRGGWGWAGTGMELPRGQTFPATDFCDRWLHALSLFLCPCFFLVLTHKENEMFA